MSTPSGNLKTSSLILNDSLLTTLPSDQRWNPLVMPTPAPLQPVSLTETKEQTVIDQNSYHDVVTQSASSLMEPVADGNGISYSVPGYTQTSFGSDYYALPRANLPYGTGLPPSSATQPTNFYHQVTPSMPQKPPPTPVNTIESAPTQLQQHMFYEEPRWHWFYVSSNSAVPKWQPFSYLDSTRLETTYQSILNAADNYQTDVYTLAVEGGRYEVNFETLTKVPVYWSSDESLQNDGIIAEATSIVRRCSWFYKDANSGQFCPYDDDFVHKLEDAYREAVLNQSWHRAVYLSSTDVIVVQNASLVVHYTGGVCPDQYGVIPDDAPRPLLVHRGFADFAIESGEPDDVDHLVFAVHGVGPLRPESYFSRTVLDCCADMRALFARLLDDHFAEHRKRRVVNRVEVLPVSWRDCLHASDDSAEQRLTLISLHSAPRMRQFMNNTMIDVLLYSSPVYSQKVLSHVGHEMNRLYNLFRSRNANFKGGLSIVGYSLGSVIAFDLLAHQEDAPKETPNGDALVAHVADAPGLLRASPSDADSDALSNASDLHSIDAVLAALSLQHLTDTFQQEAIDFDALIKLTADDLKELRLPLGTRKKLEAFIAGRRAAGDSRPAARVDAECGRPAGAEALYGGHWSKQQVALAVCDNAALGLPLGAVPRLVFGVDHFFALGSPIGLFLAVRGVTTLPADFRLPTCAHLYNVFHPFDPFAYRLEPLVAGSGAPPPFQLPHHKGRKRMHLQIKDSLSRLSQDLKTRMLDAVRSTWRTVYEFAQAHRGGDADQLASVSADGVVRQLLGDAALDHSALLQPDLSDSPALLPPPQIDRFHSRLNAFGRLDFVLQEAPIESFNDYLFALQSHKCYWTSDDTCLKVLTELYAPAGLHPARRSSDAQAIALSPPVHLSPPRPSAAAPPSLPGANPYALTGAASRPRGPTPSRPPLAAASAPFTQFATPSVGPFMAGALAPPVSSFTPPPAAVALPLSAPLPPAAVAAASLPPTAAPLATAAFAAPTEPRPRPAVGPPPKSGFIKSDLPVTR